MAGRRLVFVTQQLDPAHPALGATVAQVAALAERVDEVVVLAASAAPGALPPRCRLRAFGSDARLARGLLFARALSLELARRPRPVAVVAHMCPIYAILAVPLARPLGVPVLLWFAHWRASGTLRLAERLSSGVISVDRRSFPLPSGKVRAIGHGIEVDDFRCAPGGDAGGPLRVLALGRYSSAKGLPVVLRAVRLARDAGVDLTLEVRGPCLSELERAHRVELERLRRELGLADVLLGDALPRPEIPSLLAGAGALVNNMEAGAPDKVVYEAAASCVPVLASNPVFDRFLEGLGGRSLRFPRDDPGALAGLLAHLARLDPAERRALGLELRRRVRAGHSVDSWAAGVLASVR